MKKILNNIAVQITRLNKIAIYGGSFNPITYDHIEIIKSVMPYVDEVWVMPMEKGKHPWYKSLIDYKYRAEMIEIALKEIGQGQLSKHPVVCMSGNDCPTIKLMRWLRNETEIVKMLGKNTALPQLYVVIGSDNAIRITDNYHKEWTQYKQLCKENKFIIIPRSPNPAIDYKLFDGSIVLINKYCIDKGSSSTAARYAIGQKKYKIAEKICPKSVVKYIKEKGLYK